MSDWNEWVGLQTRSTAFLDPVQADRMAVTLDREPRFSAGDVLPPAWHWLYFHDVVEASRLGEDGHPALGVVLPPVPLPRRMWAAGGLLFERSLVLGETATRTSMISAISPKAGRTGPLFFVTVEHHIRQEDASCVRDTQTIVYREPAAGARAETLSAPTGADFSRRWELDSTALFRYSALTFNGHRIHYDADYAREVEGYPGLVIHGPLLATLLMDHAERFVGPLKSFEYRARSPLFLPERFTVNARGGPDSVDLWAASTDGRLAMSATATYRDRTTP